jgi:hypothetical protein
MGMPCLAGAARCAGDSSSDQPRLLPAKSAAAGFACRSGALLLAHALFPDHTRGWLGWLAVPVAVADGLDALHSAVPQPARAAVAVRASRLKDRLHGKGSTRSSKHSRSSSSISSEEDEWGSGVGWVDGTGGVVQGSLHALRCLSGEQRPQQQHQHAAAAGQWLYVLKGGLVLWGPVDLLQCFQRCSGMAGSVIPGSSLSASCMVRLLLPL